MSSAVFTARMSLSGVRAFWASIYSFSEAFWELEVPSFTGGAFDGWGLGWGLGLALSKHCMVFGSICNRGSGLDWSYPSLSHYGTTFEFAWHI